MPIITYNSGALKKGPVPWTYRNVLYLMPNITMLVARYNNVMPDAKYNNANGARYKNACLMSSII